MTVLLTIASVAILAELTFTEVGKYANILEAFSTGIDGKKIGKREKANWKTAFAFR